MEMDTIKSFESLDLRNAGDALIALKHYSEKFTTKEQLTQLIEGLSVAAEGKETVLYSGRLGDVSSASIAAKFAEDGVDVRVIDKTDAAKVLGNDLFVKRLCEIKGIDPLVYFNSPRAYPSVCVKTTYPINRGLNDV